MSKSKEEKENLSSKNRLSRGKPSSSKPPPYEKPQVKCHAPLFDLTFSSSVLAGVIGAAIIAVALNSEDD